MVTFTRLEKAYRKAHQGFEKPSLAVTTFEGAQYIARKLGKYCRKGKKLPNGDQPLIFCRLPRKRKKRREDDITR